MQTMLAENNTIGNCTKDRLFNPILSCHMSGQVTCPTHNGSHVFPTLRSVQQAVWTERLNVFNIDSDQKLRNKRGNGTNKTTGRLHKVNTGD